MTKKTTEKTVKTTTTNAKETVMTEKKTTKTRIDHSEVYNRVDEIYGRWLELDDPSAGARKRIGGMKLMKEFYDDKAHFGPFCHMVDEFRKGWTPESGEPIIKVKGKKSNIVSGDKSPKKQVVASERSTMSEDGEKKTVASKSEKEDTSPVAKTETMEKTLDEALSETQGSSKDAGGYSSMTVKELRKELKDLGVTGHSKSSKEVMIKALQEAEDELTSQMSMKS